MNGAIKSCMKEANDDENPKSQIEKRNLILHKPHTLTEKYFDNLWWEKYTTDQSEISMWLGIIGCLELYTIGDSPPHNFFFEIFGGNGKYAPIHWMVLPGSQVDLL